MHLLYTAVLTEAEQLKCQVSVKSGALSYPDISKNILCDPVLLHRQAGQKGELSVHIKFQYHQTLKLLAKKGFSVLANSNNSSSCCCSRFKAVKLQNVMV